MKKTEPGDVASSVVSSVVSSSDVAVASDISDASDGMSDASVVTSGGDSIHTPVNGRPVAEQSPELQTVLGQALEQAPDAVVICNRDGVIEYANRRIVSILGYTQNELCGESVDILVPNGFRHGHHHHRDRYVKNPTPRPMGSGMQLSARHRDGSEIPVEISLSPVDGDGQGRVIAIIRDVRERRVLVNQIRSQRDHLNMIVEALEDGLIEVDLNTSTFMQTNERFCQIIGYSREEVLGATIPTPWLAETDIASVRSRLLHEPSVRLESTLTHRNGTVIPVSLSASQLMKEDDLFTLVAVFHDLTQERHDALLVSQSRERVAIAEERDRIGRDLHDTVIQRLFATGMLLQSAAGRPDERDRVARAVADIDAAIRELRTSIFSMTTPGEDMSVSDAISITTEEARRVFDGVLQVRIAKGVDYRVSDMLRDELIAVIRESLTNVVKHAKAQRAQVDVTIEGDEVVVRIFDNGTGFDPTTLNGGHGLRNLTARANRLSGHCSIESSSGSTRITFSAPLQ